VKQRGINRRLHRERVLEEDNWVEKYTSLGNADKSINQNFLKWPK